MRKRLLSLFLVLCMMTTMLPATVFAAGGIVAVSGTSDMADSKNPAADGTSDVSDSKPPSSSDTYDKNGGEIQMDEDNFEQEPEQRPEQESEGQPVNATVPDEKSDTDSAMSLRSINDLNLVDVNAPGESAPSGVDALYAQWREAGAPQFDLTDGGTYYFDLSAEAGNIGTVNGKLPDKTLHYVPFTYAGTVHAYSLKGRSADDETAQRDSDTAAGATDPDQALGYKGDHSLFVADYNVGMKVSWDTLNDKSLIFGKLFDTNYTLRSLSGGSKNSGSGSSLLVSPESNEWDQILSKTGIKNYDDGYSWVQDTYSGVGSFRVCRGGSSGDAARFDYNRSSYSISTAWRPALEVMNPGTLGRGGLAPVSLNLNGGKFNGGTEPLNIICAGDSFTAPAGDGLTAPKGKKLGTWNTSANGSGVSYDVGASVPKDVSALYAQWVDLAPEQFQLPVGGVYYFDLSDEAGKIGEVNPDLPDATLHYVPFTYGGTMYAYSLKSRSADDTIAKGDSTIAAGTTDTSNPIGFTGPRSLFIADNNVGKKVSWDALNAEGLIFGKLFDANYKLRSPSGGSNEVYQSVPGPRPISPENNEWDQLLDKLNGGIKNYKDGYSWVQDTYSSLGSYRAYRGGRDGAAYFNTQPSHSDSSSSWRPVLEVLNPEMLDENGLTPVTLHLNGGAFNGSADSLNIICAGGSFKAPAGDGLTAPKDKKLGTWNTAADGGGVSYDVGASVPKDVTALYAQWVELAPPQFHLPAGGTYYFDLSAEAGKIGEVNPDLPDATLHYVPFTYGGTMYAYSLKSRSADDTIAKGDSTIAAGTTDTSNPIGFTGPRSLFIADNNVGKKVSWDALNAEGLIFGKLFDANYKLRSPSGGSNEVYQSAPGPRPISPENNEWDQLLDKLNGGIKNYQDGYSWVQDTYSGVGSFRAYRGGRDGAAYFNTQSSHIDSSSSWRPVLEVLNPEMLDENGLTPVTLHLNGGTFNGSADSLNIICAGGSFKAPESSVLTAPKGMKFEVWNTAADGGGASYAVGVSVPKSVTALYAQWVDPAPPQFHLPAGGTYYFDLSAEAGKIGAVNPDLPDATLHYVPFNFAGTVYAYSLKGRSGDDTIAETDSDTAAGAIDPNNPIGFVSPRSLFVAEYNVSEATWNTLNKDGLIFGKPFDTHYTLRSLSGGGSRSYLSASGTYTISPESNEWDQILWKSGDSIKNYSRDRSWTQDTFKDVGGGAFRVYRGGSSDAAYFGYDSPTSNYVANWRPALEVLDPDTLGGDGLTAVTLNLNGGTFNGSADSLNIICAGGSFKAPESSALTAPKGMKFEVWNTAADGGGDSYAVGVSVPKDVTALYAQWVDPATPQFHLPAGGTYYFDLSAEAGQIGAVNPDLPDATLHYVPFNFAGTVYAYSLKGRSGNDTIAETDSDTAAGATDPNNPIGFVSPRSLFVAEYNVSKEASWDTLNNGGLIFGKPFDTHYTLRSLSGGSSRSYLSASGTYTISPESNEWDQILWKSGDSIKNYSRDYSWTQDTSENVGSFRVYRGGSSGAAYFGYNSPTSSYTSAWRPALEVLDPDTLGGDGLTAVTLNLNGGRLKASTADLNIICAGDSCTAPGSTGLTRPSGISGSYFKWNTQADGKGADYEVGASVPKGVTTLYARWQKPVEPLVFTDSADYDIPASTVGIPIVPIQISGGVSGGTTPYTFSAVNLPDGITISMDGVISGTPTAVSAAGSAEITVTDRTEPTVQTASITVAYGGVKAAGPTAPSVTFSFDGVQKNRLMGATTAMEYRLDGSGSETGWLTCTDNDMDLSTSLDSITAEHDIKIRVKETAASLAGDVQTIDITQAVKPNLTATQPDVIGGEGSIPMTAAHEYSMDEISWTAAGGTTYLAAGTYYVRVKAAGTTLASPSQTITLTAFAETQEPMPSAVFTADSENGGILSHVTNGMKYSLDGGTSWTSISESSVELTGVTLTGVIPGKGIQVRQPGNGTTTTDSQVQNIAVTQGATPNLTATQPDVIGGEGSIPMTAAHEYSMDEISWTAAGGTTYLAAGTYYVRVKAAGTTLASPSQTITLTAFDETQEPMPSAVFTADSENGGILSHVTNGMKYSLDGGTSWTSISESSVELTGVTLTGVIPGKGIQVRQPGNGTTTTDSQVQNIAVTQGAAVFGVTETGCTTSDNNDGILRGVTTTMEYKWSEDSLWTRGSGNDITGLVNGIYYVRTKAAGTALAGETSSFTISAYNAPEVYAVTVNSGSGGGSYAPGVRVEITANDPPYGQVFDRWVSVDGVEFENAASAHTSFTMPEKAVTVTAEYKNKETGGGSTGGGGSSGGGSHSSSADIVKLPDADSTAKLDVTAGMDQNGNASVTVPDEAVSEAIQKAQAGETGSEQDRITIVADVNIGKEAVKAVVINLPKATQEKLIAKKVANFTLAVDQLEIKITLNFDTVCEINRQANDDVQLTIERITSPEELSAEGRAAIGGRPAYHLTATYQDGEKEIMDFDKGRVCIELPYVLQKGETAGNIAAVYVDASGRAAYLPDSSYDSRLGVLTFTTNHFSIYGIGYKMPPVSFNDIQNHWAKADIEFAVERGLFSGTGNDAFSPDSPMTRGMFVTALGKLAGIDPDSYKTCGFTDVKTDAYYSPYVSWAAEKQIVKGTSASTFAPDQSVSRQEMAVIMANYAKAMSCTVPKTRTEIIFADSGLISQWAKEAVRAMQMAGVLNGKGGNRFDPASATTRAEAAAVLHHFVELVIDPADG